jgi:hypothetical protein
VCSEKGDDLVESLEKNLSEGTAAVKAVRRPPRNCIPGCRQKVADDALFPYCPEHFDMYSVRRTAPHAASLRLQPSSILLSSSLANRLQTACKAHPT